MNVKTYMTGRRLQMVKESQSLGEQRQKITVQSQALQTQLNQVNQQMLRLDVELEVLDKLEVSLNGHKEDKKC